MTVAAELQDAARAIRSQTPPTATFHRATAALLDHLALSAPHYKTELHLAPATRLALAVARSFQDPAGRGPSAGTTVSASRRAAVPEVAAGPGQPAATPGGRS
jgi:hypothetical protein